MYLASYKCDVCNTNIAAGQRSLVVTKDNVVLDICPTCLTRLLTVPQAEPAQQE